MTDTKTCKRCGQEKARTEFTKDKAAKDGLRIYCTECSRAAVRASMEAHPERAKARRKLENTARYNADKRLRAKYKEEYSVYVAEERARLRKA